MSASHEVAVVVVGAGVVGLAVAAELAESGRTVLLVERRGGPGRETSSRNSEVIHGGLYYPTDSLKARLCVEGRHLLYELCARAGVGHRRLGKLIVACSEGDLAELERLHALGTANGVEGLELIDGNAVAKLEPAVRALAALWSPETGIIDSHGLIKVLEARFAAAGGLTLYSCELVGVEPRSDRDPGFELRLRNPVGEEVVGCRVLVNSAGLDADRVAALAGCPGYQLHWCKGDYFTAAGASGRLVSRLIYPVPQPNYLGIHVTLDLAGRVRLGPDAVYIERAAGQHLDVAESKVSKFSVSVERFLPALRADDLQPDMAGIRPKLQGPGDSFRDFVIQSEQGAAVPRLCNLIGIESPGLTSCLAIGKMAHAIVLAID